MSVLNMRKQSCDLPLKSNAEDYSQKTLAAKLRGEKQVTISLDSSFHFLTLWRLQLWLHVLFCLQAKNSLPVWVLCLKSFQGTILLWSSNLWSPGRISTVWATFEVMLTRHTDACMIWNVTFCCIPENWATQSFTV